MSATPYNEQPVSNHSIWKPAVVGLGDSMIISLALVTVLYNVHTTLTGIFTLTCVAALFGALLVGIAGYFAAKFRMESLALKSEEEQQQLNEEETAKTIDLFKRLDLGADMQQQAASEIEKDSAEWKTFIEKNNQPFELPDKKQLPATGLMMGLAYLAGALFPLLAFIIWDDMDAAFKYTLIFSLTAVYLCGYAKSYINGEPLLWGSVRQLLLGVAAVVCAWMIAIVFFMMTP